MAELTHFDAAGKAAMVDVGEKPRTRRQAVAAGRIRMSRSAFEQVQRGTADKGDVLGVARVAGIMAVKRTADLIPLCHTLLIEKAAVDFSLDEAGLEIEAVCTVKTTGVTGVEMEALTGVSAALLTIYDMCKAADKGMVMTGIRLVEKTGGKSGTWRAEELG